MSTTQKLRLAIVGGGIGGLTLAVALSHMNLDEFLQVDLYEAAVKLNEVGAGIGFSPHTWEVLKEFGLAEDLKARMVPGQSPPDHKPKLAFVFRKSDEQNGSPFFDLVLPSGAYIMYHRADLQEVLLSHVSSMVEFHLNHRLINYTESEEGIKLEFKNGKTATCDILVGADGINSVVRKVLLAGKRGLDSSSEEALLNAAPVWTGTWAYRGLVDSEIVRREFPNHPALSKPTLYCGKNKHIASFPVSKGKFISVAPCVTEWDKEGTLLQGPASGETKPEDFVHLFEGWEPEAQCLVKNMNKKVNKWAIQTVRPLDTYSTERVILLGDAAHAMTPYLGSGAGQGIEDASIFANLLNKLLRQGSKDVRKITSIYTTVRQPRGNEFVLGSREQGTYYEFTAPGLEDLQEGDPISAERLSELGKAIDKGWELTWNYSAEDNLQRALEML